MLRPVYLLNDTLTKSHIKKLSRQTVSGIFVYTITTILAYWLPILALIIIFALFILWVGMSIGDKVKD